MKVKIGKCLYCDRDGVAMSTRWMCSDCRELRNHATEVRCLSCGATDKPMKSNVRCKECDSRIDAKIREILKIEKERKKIKAKTVDDFCYEAKKRGLTYAQYQAQETVALLKGARFE